MAQRMKLRGFPLWINAEEHDGAMTFTAEPLNEIQTTQVWYHWKAEKLGFTWAYGRD